MDEPNANPVPADPVPAGPSTDKILKLQHLSSKRFAELLWQQKLETSAFPSKFSYLTEAFVEQCQDEILERLNENDAQVPIHCKIAITREVKSLARQMIDEYPKTDLANLIDYLLKTQKWRSFVFSWLSCLKQKVGEQVFLFVFEQALKKVELRGLSAMSEDELSLYLQIWNNTSRQSKLNIFEILSCFYVGDVKRYTPGLEFDNLLNKKLKNFPRDIGFLIKLITYFDTTDRKQIWNERWLDLIFGVSPERMEPLMRLCCDPGDQQFDQFKSTWLARPDIIDSYYCSLIKKRRETELQLILDFFSKDESQKLKLCKDILDSYFFKTPVPEGYADLMRIVKQGGSLAKAVRMPDFEHLFRADTAKMRKYSECSMRQGNFTKLHDLLIFLLPETPSEEIVSLERQLATSFFLQNYHNYFCGNSTREMMLSEVFFKRINHFRDFISRVFPNEEEANTFKKDVIFTSYMCENMLEFLLNGYSQRGFLTDLVNMCFASQRHLIPVWKDHFVEFFTLRMAKSTPNKIKKLFDRGNGVLGYILDTADRKAKFKQLLSVEDLFEILTDDYDNNFDVRRITHDADGTLNKILNWGYDVIDDRVDFKMRKLKEYANNEAVLNVLLGKERPGLRECQNEEQTRALVLRSLATS